MCKTSVVPVCRGTTGGGLSFDGAMAVFCTHCVVITEPPFFFPQGLAIYGVMLAPWRAPFIAHKLTADLHEEEQSEDISSLQKLPLEFSRSENERWFVFSFHEVRRFLNELLWEDWQMQYVCVHT